MGDGHYATGKDGVTGVRTWSSEEFILLANANGIKVTPGYTHNAFAMLPNP